MRPTVVCLLVCAACGEGAAPSGFRYRDPAAGSAKIRLSRNAASSGDRAVLDLIAVAPLRGWAVGFDLPLDATRVALDEGAPLLPGAALPPGEPPIAAKAVLPDRGPLASTLVVAQSQKSGDDAAIATGAVLLSVQLVRRAGATPGPVFDGATLDARFRAALLDKQGNETVHTGEFAIGRLELR